MVVDFRRSISFAFDRLMTDFDFVYELIGSIGNDELSLIFNCDQFLETSFTYQCAVGKNTDAVANFLCLREQMRREQHSDSAALQVENQIANFPRACRIDTGGRFIEHHQPRIMNQCLRKTNALQHSFGISAQPTIARFVQADEVEQFVYRVPSIGSLASPQRRPKETQRFFAGQILVEVWIFRQKTDCLPAFYETTIAPKNFSVPARWGNQPENNFESCAFAGTIRSEQAVHFAWFYAKVEILYGYHLVSL